MSGTTTIFRVENWKEVPSNPLLEASSLGRVRSKPYETPMPQGRGFKINQLSPTLGITVTIGKNYKRKQIVFRRKTYRVAKLVCEAFLGECPSNKEISHKDENSLNNCVDNLEYVTHKENCNQPNIQAYQSRVCVVKMSGNSPVY